MATPTRSAWIDIRAKPNSTFKFLTRNSTVATIDRPDHTPRPSPNRTPTTHSPVPPKNHPAPKSGTAQRTRWAGDPPATHGNVVPSNELLGPLARSSKPRPHYYRKYIHPVARKTAGRQPRGWYTPTIVRIFEHSMRRRPRPPRPTPVANKSRESTGQNPSRGAKSIVPLPTYPTNPIEWQESKYLDVSQNAVAVNTVLTPTKPTRRGPPRAKLNSIVRGPVYPSIPGTQKQGNGYRTRTPIEPPMDKSSIVKYTRLPAAIVKSYTIVAPSA